MLLWPPRSPKFSCTSSSQPSTAKTSSRPRSKTTSTATSAASAAAWTLRSGSPAEPPATQKEHHARVDFKDEIRALLKKYNVEYDEAFVWE